MTILTFGANVYITANLFQSYCLSCYGSPLWDLSCRKTMDKLFVTWRKCLRRVLKIPTRTHCDLLPIIIDSDDLATQLHRWFLNYLINACRSKNMLIKTASKLVINGTVCNYINFMARKYDFEKYSLLQSSVPKISIKWQFLLNHF